MTPETRESLFNVLRNGAVHHVWEAAETLAFSGDATLIPRLIQERDAIDAELRCFDDSRRYGYEVREGERVTAVEMTIISLMSPQEREFLLETGSDFQKSRVRLLQSRGSVEAFWAR